MYDYALTHASATSGPARPSKRRRSWRHRDARGAGADRGTGASILSQRLSRPSPRRLVRGPARAARMALTRSRSRPRAAGTCGAAANDAHEDQVVHGRRNSGSFLTPLLNTPMKRPLSEPRAAVVKVIFFCFWSARRRRPVLASVGQWGWFQLWGVARQRFCAAVIAVQGVGPLEQSKRCLALRLPRFLSIKMPDENPNCLPVIFSKKRHFP